MHIAWTFFYPIIVFPGPIHVYVYPTVKNGTVPMYLLYRIKIVNLYLHTFLLSVIFFVENVQETSKKLMIHSNTNNELTFGYS